MARENQGLHAALIVFVVLTIVFAVMAFVFFSQANTAKEAAKISREKAGVNEDLAKDRDKLLKEFQQKMMGFAPTDDADTVRDLFKQDMDKYAPKDLEDQSRFYRQALRRQFELIKLANDSYETELEKVKKLEEDLANVKEQTKTKIAEFEARAKEYQTDLNRQQRKFDEDRSKLEASQKQLADEIEQLKKDHHDALVQKDSQITKLKEDLKDTLLAYANVKKTVDEMRQEVPNEFRGEIRLVNQRNRTVWVNRGSDDGIRPQTKLSVFPSGMTNVAEADKKASIEITRVISGHLSEARIVEDNPLNPILVGDKIYTPLWNLGERRHFAFAGFIDVDGDGHSDLERMYTLVDLNGGVVDARMDTKGVRKGDINMNTRYLVLGDELDFNAPAELREDYNRIITKAEKLKIPTIRLNEFLDLMGWVHQVQVSRYGNPGPGEFRPEKDTARPVSRGGISDLFKPRRPPADHVQDNPY